MKQCQRKSGIHRLLELSGRRKGLLTVSALTVIVHALLTMVPYILIFFILDGLLIGKINASEINTFLFWAVLCIIISAVMLFASGLASHIAAFNILYELRCKISEKPGLLPMGYLKDRSSGSLKKILADDVVERIEKFIAHSLPDTIKALVLPLVVLTYLFVIDWRLVLASFLPIVILVVAVPFANASEAGKERIKKYHASLEEMNGGIVEFVRAMPVMKIFGQSATAFVKYSGTVKNFDHHIKCWNRLTAPVWGMIMSFLTNALLPILIFGLVLYFKGDLGLSVLFLFLILGVGYIRPAFKLATILPEITMISRGVDRMDEILFEVAEQKSGTAQLPSQFTLEVKNARFSYTHGPEVIKGVGFSVAQGTITALVGPSGSGKSTLGQLIARFYDLSSGSITPGGVNINDLPARGLMDHVGFVFQDNMMFRQSLYDNIRMGMDKTREEVMAAARTARCHDFIMQLPHVIPVSAIRAFI